MYYKIFLDEENRFIIQVDIDVPNGIKMDFNAFKNLSKLTFENIINSIWSYPKSWIFEYSPLSDYIWIDVDTKEIIIPNLQDVITISKNLCFADWHFKYLFKTSEYPFIDTDL